MWSDFLDPIYQTDVDTLLPTLSTHVDLIETINPKDQHAISHVWPLDEHNTTLLNNVHPPEWQDPQAPNKDGSYVYDLVVIGAGAGGLVTSAGAAGVGAKVALIEENLLGGDWYVLVELIDVYFVGNDERGILFQTFLFCLSMQPIDTLLVSMLVVYHRKQ